MCVIKSEGFAFLTFKVEPMPTIESALVRVQLPLRHETEHMYWLDAGQRYVCIPKRLAVPGADPDTWLIPDWLARDKGLVSPDLKPLEVRRDAPEYSPCQAASPRRKRKRK